MLFTNQVHSNVLHIDTMAHIWLCVSCWLLSWKTVLLACVQYLQKPASGGLAVAVLPRVKRTEGGLLKATCMFTVEPK